MDGDFEQLKVVGRGKDGGKKRERVLLFRALLRFLTYLTTKECFNSCQPKCQTCVPGNCLNPSDDILPTFRYLIR